MNTTLLERFAPTIQSLASAELEGGGALNEKLRLAQSGGLEVCYAPFEHINTQARIVIVGITPGRTQMLNAIREARTQLDNGVRLEKVLLAAKRTAAFSGAMRPNLVALLDSVGLNSWLGLCSCESLFGASAHLVQTTSVLRNPVFVNGENYNGTPNMIKHPILKEMIVNYFGEDAQALPQAVFIPLGDKVADALHYLAAQGLLSKERIIEGLPHPSGANAERISYFLGKKLKSDLSVKTNATKMDIARDAIMHRVTQLA